MVASTVVHLAKPLKAVQILGDRLNRGDSDMLDIRQVDRSQQNAHEQFQNVEEIQEQKELYQDACLTFQNAVDRLNQLYDEIFAGHSDAIARLSVEIARKILMQKLSDGDYEIESIIKEAIKNAPEKVNLTVRLSPQDLANYQQLQFSGEAELSDIEFVADSDIGRAECVVESPKGIVKFLINEHLEQISKALTKAG